MTGGVLCHIVDALGGEFLDRFRQQMSIIRHRHMLGFFTAQVDDRLFIGHQLPFEAHLGAIAIKQLDVLAGGVEQRAGDLGGDIGIFQFDVAAFDGVGRAIFGD